MALQADLFTFGLFAIWDRNLSTSRGGEYDWMCLALLTSALLYEFSEIFFYGIHRIRDYLSLGNMADNVGRGCLLIGFIFRIWGLGGGFNTVNGKTFAPESWLFSIGFLVSWSRAWGNLLHEFEGPAKLMDVSGAMLLKDVSLFTVVLVFVFLIGFGIAAAALNSEVDSENDLASTQFYKFIIGQFIWPLAQEEDYDFGMSVDAGNDRPIGMAYLFASVLFTNWLLFRWFNINVRFRLCNKSVDAKSAYRYDELYVRGRHGGSITRFQGLQSLPRD